MPSRGGLILPKTITRHSKSSFISSPVPLFALGRPYSIAVCVLLPLMNEYVLGLPEYSGYEEGVGHAQLAYAPYAVLLATVEVASLLGRRRGEGRQSRKCAHLNS